MAGRSYSQAFQEPSRAKGYDEGSFRPGGVLDSLWQVEQHVLLNVMRKHYPGCASANALDFACGHGRITKFLTSHVASVVGVDISQAMLERARGNVPGAQFVCADIVESPQEVPEGKDIITCFRFFPRAEPSLRLSCLKALATKLRSRDSIMILGLHLNPHGRRAIKRLFVKRARQEPCLSLGQMTRLANECGLQVVGATGLGFIPLWSLGQILPRGVFILVERILADKPLIWRMGDNLIVVCRLS